MKMRLFYFSKESNRAYKVALRNKWLDEMNWLITNKNN